MFWKSFLSYTMLTCSVLSFVIGWLLWSRQHINQYTNRLLALLLFVYAYIYFVTVLVIDGTIMHVPHFFRTAAPLNYVVGPLIYLYVRESLLSSTRFRSWYLWLFLPAFFNFIEWIPFYSQNAAYKAERLKNLIQAPNTLVSFNESIFPAHFHLIGYSLSSLIYSLLAARLVWSYYRYESKDKHRNPVYDQWIRTFISIQVLANAVWVIEIPFISQSPYANVGLNITFSIAQLIICVYIIQRPALLYGAYELLVPSLPAPPPLLIRPTASPATTSPQQESRQTNTPTFSAALEPNLLEKLNQLEVYMLTEKPYLRPRLSLADVSVATDIPPYLLSAILNRALGVDFRDYVNGHRVQHLCALLDSNDFSHLTLEGISTQAGFSSKTTFYRAFQKHTGLTPAQYALNRPSPNS